MSKGRRTKVRPLPAYDVFFERVRALMEAIPPPNEYKGTDEHVAQVRLLPYIAFTVREMGMPKNIDELWIDAVIGFEQSMKVIMAHPNWPVPPEMAAKAFGQVEYWTYCNYEYRDKAQRDELPPLRK